MSSDSPIDVPPVAVQRETDGPIPSLLDANPGIFDHAEFGCDDEDIAELEEALGHGVPEQLEALLRFSDGGTLHGPTRHIHLATTEELADWAQRGLMSELDGIPFAQDESGTILVCDSDGDWGGEAGAIYRLDMGRRTIRGHPIQDAVRVAGSIEELLGHVVAGKDAW